MLLATVAAGAVIMRLVRLRRKRGMTRSALARELVYSSALAVSFALLKRLCCCFTRDSRETVSKHAARDAHGVDDATWVAPHTAARGAACNVGVGDNRGMLQLPTWLFIQS